LKNSSSLNLLVLIRILSSRYQAFQGCGGISAQLE